MNFVLNNDIETISIALVMGGEKRYVYLND